MTPVRVRFAPSPTGSIHIGTARTALFNWLYARKTGGALVLRVEDTDKERNTQEALEDLLSCMRWLGIDWDEGPEAGGPNGPYFQSQRAEIYASYLDKLRGSGRVYEKEGAQFFRLQGERYSEYDDYHKAEVEKVRSKPVVIDDLIRGRVSRREERDFVLVRSNGDPSFHFVNVVDDIAMGITHVLRGEDHLSNTSKHIELYNALGVHPPIYAHMPMILKDPAQGKGKMSKRDRGALIDDYQNRDFLPEALVNFIALLGWSPKDDQEILSRRELIERFDLADLQKAGARFDEKKLSHVNFEHMKRLSPEDYYKLAYSSLSKAGLVDQDTDREYLSGALRLCQAKISRFEDLPSFAAYFFTEDYPENEKTAKKLRKRGDLGERVQEITPVLKALEPWTAQAIERGIEGLAAEKQLQAFAWYPLLRFAVSGTGGGPDLLPMLETLGKQTVLARLERFKASLA